MPRELKEESNNYYFRINSNKTKIIFKHLITAGHVVINDGN